MTDAIARSKGPRAGSRSPARSRARRGERWFDGRLFILAGRGTLESCHREADSLAKRWRSVRIVAAWKGRVLDDYMIYVFDRIE